MEAIAETTPDLAEQLPGWLDQCAALPIEACVKQLGLELEPVRSAHPDAQASQLMPPPAAYVPAEHTLHIVDASMSKSARPAAQSSHDVAFADEY